MSKKNVAKKNETQVDMFSDQRPEWMGDSERGSEGISLDDVVIPRLDVIQSLSPQRKKTDPAYIDGAEEGLLFNTVTGVLYGSEVIFVPVVFRKEWVIWKNRDEGGGFKGAFHDREESENALENMPDALSCEIMDTHQQFGLILWNDGSDIIEEVVISCSRSKMKPSRQLNSMVRMTGGDRWSRAYRVASVAVDGPKGDYYSFRFAQLGFVSEHVFEVAESLYTSVMSGARDVARDEAVVAETTDY